MSSLKHVMCTVICFTAILLFSACGQKKAAEADDTASPPLATAFINEEAATSYIKISNQITDDYAAFLNILETGTESIPKALGKYRELIKDTSDVQMNDELFRMFEEYFNNVRNAIQTEIMPAEDMVEKITEFSYDGFYLRILDEQEIVHEEYKQAAGLLRQNGCALFQSEGGFGLIEDPFFLVFNFSDSVSDGVREYLILKSNERKIGFLTEDSYLWISWDELSDRIITWETYSDQYPGTPEAEKATKEASYYVDFYLTANFMDNTLMFDNGVLSGALRASYQRFIVFYPESEYHDLVSGYYTVLEKNNFQLSEVIQSYLKDNGYEFWLPERGEDADESDE